MNRVATGLKLCPRYLKKHVLGYMKQSGEVQKIYYKPHTGVRDENGNEMAVIRTRGRDKTVIPPADSSIGDTWLWRLKPDFKPRINIATMDRAVSTFVPPVGNRNFYKRRFPSLSRNTKSRRRFPFST